MLFDQHIVSHKEQQSTIDELEKVLLKKTQELDQLIDDKEYTDTKIKMMQDLNQNLELDLTDCQECINEQETKVNELTEINDILAAEVIKLKSVIEAI